MSTNAPGVPDIRRDDFAERIPPGLISGPQLAARLGVAVNEVQRAIDRGLVPRRERWFSWREVRRELKRQILAGAPPTFTSVATLEDLSE